VARSVGNAENKRALNLQTVTEAQNQMGERYRASGVGGPGGKPVDEFAKLTDGESLAKLDSPMAPLPTTSVPAARPVAGGGRGGAGMDAIAAPIDGSRMVADGKLNLGNQSVNGWQTMSQARAYEGQVFDSNKERVQVAQNTQGYRVVTNYAQQSRVINSRAFFLNGNQWTDSRTQNVKADSHIKVVFGSADYFELLKKYPDAAQYLALGNNVTVELGGKIYDIVEEEVTPAATPKP